MRELTAEKVGAPQKVFAALKIQTRPNGLAVQDEACGAFEVAGKKGGGFLQRGYGENRKKIRSFFIGMW